MKFLNFFYTWLKEPSNRLRFFIWTWTFGVLIFAQWAAFYVYPYILETHTDTFVKLYFQSEYDSKSKIKYFQNVKQFRDIHLSKLTDNEFLYYSKCDFLPLNKRPQCDKYRNWRKIKTSYFNCMSVKNCEKSLGAIGIDEKKSALIEVQDKNRNSMNKQDEDLIFHISNPLSWGYLARLPLFFFIIYLGMKVGKSITEFHLIPYQGRHEVKLPRNKI